MRLQLNIGLDAGAWIALLRSATPDEMVEAFDALQKFFAAVENHAIGHGDLSGSCWAEMAEDAGDLAKNARKIAFLRKSLDGNPGQ